MRYIIFSMFPSIKYRHFWNLLFSRLFMAAVFFFILFFLVNSPSIVKSVVENQTALSNLHGSFYQLRYLYYKTAPRQAESEFKNAQKRLRRDLHTLLERPFFTSMREFDSSFAEVMEEAEKRIDAYIGLERGTQGGIEEEEKQAQLIEQVFMKLKDLVKTNTEEQYFSIRIQNLFLIAVIALFAVAFIYLDVKAKVEERKKEQMKSLSRRYIADFEGSSKRVALEIHDTVLQELAVVRRFHHIVQQKQSAKECEKEWEIIDSALDKSSTTLRNIIDHIQPWDTEHLSFEEVLRTSLGDFMHDDSIDMDVWVTPLPETTLKDDEKQHILSILREALSNVQKHSGASRVRVKVEWQVPILTVSIADNGRGFKTDRYQKVSSNHIGLYSMRERASMAGGTLSITSTPGRGTEILFRLKK